MVSVLGFQEASCSLLDLNQAKLNMMVYLGWGVLLNPEGSIS